MAQLFRENNVGFERVNYFSEPLTEEILRGLLTKANLAPIDLVRKKEPLYKELKISDETVPDEIIKLLVENPNLLQRPIVEVGDKAVLARPIEKALKLINE